MEDDKKPVMSTEAYLIGFAVIVIAIISVALIAAWPAIANEPAIRINMTNLSG